MRRKEKLEISFLQMMLIVGIVAIGAFFYGHNCGMQQAEQTYQQEKEADEKLISELMQDLYE